jgi:hypothetical protein
MVVARMNGRYKHVYIQAKGAHQSTNWPAMATDSIGSSLRRGVVMATQATLARKP